MSYVNNTTKLVVYTHRGAVLDLSQWLTSASTSKALHGPSGTMTAGVKLPKGHPSLQDIVGDDDWCILTTVGPSGVPRVQLGLVDAVTRDRVTSSNGTTTRAYSIQMRDAGKPFETHEFRLHAGLPVYLPGLLRLTGDGVVLGQAAATLKPSEVFRRLFKHIFRPTKVRKTTAKPDAPGSIAAPKLPAVAPLTLGQLTTNFHVKEFASPDGAPMPPEVQTQIQALAGHLQTLRNDYFGNAKVTIISGYRSAQANAKAQGAPKSRHKTGQAADISVKGMASEVVAAKIKDAINDGVIPFGGIGLYSTFVHYDIGTGSNRPALWLGEGATAPTAAQSAGFMPWTPTPTPDVAVIEDNSEANEPSVKLVIAPVADTEHTESASGDGAFVAPKSMAATYGVGGLTSGKVAQYDWVDVVDTETWADKPAQPDGRWWRVIPLYGLQATAFDGFVRSQANSTFVELFYDTLPVPPESKSAIAGLLGGWAPCVVFRRRPLDYNDWQKLPLFALPGEHVLSERLTRSGAERFNYFYVRLPHVADHTGPMMDALVAGGSGYIPAIDVDSVKVHGLRTFNATDAFAYTADGLPPLATQIVDANKRAYRWNWPLPGMRSGTVEFPYFSEMARVGNRITWQSDDVQLEGYIEAVSETWSVDPARGAVQTRTTCHVTRVHVSGQYPGAGSVDTATVTESKLAPTGSSGAVIGTGTQKYTFFEETGSSAPPIAPVVDPDENDINPHRWKQ